MADITKCLNDKCSKRKDCRRATEPDSFRQSYAHFEPETDKYMEFYCEHFLSNRFTEQNKELMERRAFDEWLSVGGQNVIQILSGKFYVKGSTNEQRFRTPFEAWQNLKRAGKL